MGYCPRQILLNKLGVKRYDAQTHGRFQGGDFIHDYIQQEVLPGHRTTHEQQVVHEEDGLRFKGHYDCFDGNVVYDFKSRSSWYRFDPPYDRHLDQLHVYMRALDVDHGMVVYVAKSDLSVETYPDYFGTSDRDVDETGELVTFDPDRWARIMDRARQVHDYLDANGLPSSIKAVNAAFPPCSNDECMGCKFEDDTAFDFSHITEVDA